MFRLYVIVAFFAVLLLASCSQQANVTKASTNSGEETSARESGPVSGKTAFWEMYRSAHAWSPDLVPLSLESKSLNGVKNAEGKAEIWSATFGSMSKHQAATFSYAVAAHSPDISKGVTAGNPVPWSGPAREALPFDSSDLSIDSDEAYKTALAKAEPWVKAHPGREVSLTLGNASRFPGPVWYVLWGDKKSGYAVFVNAKTGAVIK
ncbi:MAG: PepSY domain-containing protein [Actinomycetota bacterium]